MQLSRCVKQLHVQIDSEKEKSLRVLPAKSFQMDD